MTGHDPARVGSREAPTKALLRILSITTRDRLELVTLELEEAKRRVVALFVWTVLALIGGIQAILLTGLVILYLVPAGLRQIVAVALVAVIWLLVGWAVARTKALLRETGHPFATTLNQLQKDLECLRNGD